MRIKIIVNDPIRCPDQNSFQVGIKEFTIKTDRYEDKNAFIHDLSTRGLLIDQNWYPFHSIIKMEFLD